MGSNTIHDTLQESNSEKSWVIDALFSDQLFNHTLAHLLFHSKIVGNSKLENFLHERIKKLLGERNTSHKLGTSLEDVYSKIQDKIAQLKEKRAKYSQQLEFS